MRKYFLILALIASSIYTATAQVDDRAFGVRFGGLPGLGVELSYQHPLSRETRLEIDYGFNPLGKGVYGIYQWVWDASFIADGVNFYAGPGVLLAVHKLNKSFGVVGQIGFEVNLDTPVRLSIDYRPSLHVAPELESTWDRLCFAVRYTF